MFINSISAVEMSDPATASMSSIPRTEASDSYPIRDWYQNLARGIHDNSNNSIIVRIIVISVIRMPCSSLGLRSPGPGAYLQLHKLSRIVYPLPELAG